MVERRPETAGTTFSAYTAYMANQPWHVILLYSSGFFAFSIVAIGNHLGLDTR
jgi:hypothetical protein